jgi:hypothetical protein
MGKKKVRKKSNFKYSSPRKAEKAPLERSSVPSAAEISTTAENQGYSHVVRAVSRVAVLTTFLVLAQLILWYLVTRTSANRIYDLIKL